KSASGRSFAFPYLLPHAGPPPASAQGTRSSPPPPRRAGPARTINSLPTSMNVLVLNAGSSSLKFQLIQTSEEQITADADVRMARGIIERIGGQALLTLEVTGQPTHRETAPIR